MTYRPLEGIQLARLHLDIMGFIRKNALFMLERMPSMNYYVHSVYSRMEWMKVFTL